MVQYHIASGFDGHKLCTLLSASFTYALMILVLRQVVGQMRYHPVRSTYLQ